MIDSFDLKKSNYIKLNFLFLINNLLLIVLNYYKNY